MDRLPSHVQLGLANGRYQQVRRQEENEVGIPICIPSGLSISPVFLLLITSGRTQVAELLSIATVWASHPVDSINSL